RLRLRLEAFLERVDLADSALIIDGPGPGLASHFVALALLGPARVNQLGHLHSVSASAYGVLYFVAWHRGLITLTPRRIDDFNRANQARHGVGGWGAAGRLLLGKVRGARYLFSNDRAEEVLAYGVHPDFIHTKVAALPHNLSFWTYCVERRELGEIRRDSGLADWSLGEVIRAVTAVNGIYAPFHKEGQSYVDAVTAPQLRQLYRDLRAQYRDVLFLHMNRDGVQGNTSFVRMHHTGSGRLRIMLDFLYFLSGIENRDVNEAIRVSLAVPPI
ncbi:MAG: hypothetical protein ACRDHF_18940, partial [Tepidiformaceae bacterium]